MTEICKAGTNYECAERGCYAASVGVPEACQPLPRPEDPE